MQKRCNKCRASKPLSDFSTHPKTNDKLSYYCKACLKLYAREYRKKYPEHTVLRSLIDRCTNPHNPSYQYYGAKGIRVCDEWRNFKTFLSDVGKRPSKKYTLIRIDETKGFERGNCKWALRGYWANRFTSPTMKLTVDNVKEIKAGLKAGIKGSVLGRKFGVTRACISLIKKNQTWRAA